MSVLSIYLSVYAYVRSKRCNDGCALLSELYQRHGLLHSFVIEWLIVVYSTLFALLFCSLLFSSVLQLACLPPALGTSQVGGLGRDGGGRRIQK